MRSGTLGSILAGVGLALASLPAAAQSPPLQTRGATITIEKGVRVIRPLPASAAFRANYVPDYRRVYVYSAKEVAADRFAMFNSVPRNQPRNQPRYLRSVGKH